MQRSYDDPSQRADWSVWQRLNVLKVATGYEVSLIG